MIAGKSGYHVKKRSGEAENVRHPYWSGFLLALTLMLAQVFATPVDLLAFCDRSVELIGGADAAMGPVLLAGGVVMGALVASLPGRLRRRETIRQRISPGRCAACFAGGAAAVTGCCLAEGGFTALLLTGTWTGTVSGMAFAAIVLLSGCLASSAMGRRKCE